MALYVFACDISQKRRARSIRVMMLAYGTFLAVLPFYLGPDTIQTMIQPSYLNTFQEPLLLVYVVIKLWFLFQAMQTLRHYLNTELVSHFRRCCTHFFMISVSLMTINPFLIIFANEFLPTLFKQSIFISNGLAALVMIYPFYINRSYLKTLGQYLYKQYLLKQYQLL